MKSEFTITVETNNMNPIYDTENPANFNEEHNVMNQIEAELHKAIEMLVRQYLTEDNLTESIINGYIVDYNSTSLEEIENLGECGNIIVHIKKKDTNEQLVNISKIMPELQEKMDGDDE